MASEAEENAWITGTILRWKKTHGFLKYGEGDEEKSLFFHETNVKYTPNKKVTLRPGMQIKFHYQKGATETDKPSAVDVCARDGGLLDFHKIFGDTDQYDRIIQFDEKWFTGRVKFFDRVRGYGRIRITQFDELDEVNAPKSEIGPEVYFKEVDLDAEGFPVKIRSGNPVKFKLYNSEKFGWGAQTVQFGNGEKFKQQSELDQKRNRGGRGRGRDRRAGKKPRDVEKTEDSKTEESKTEDSKTEESKKEVETKAPEQVAKPPSGTVVG